MSENNLPIIVDSCESFGHKKLYNAKAHVFGFFPNKQITTGEGGMVVTDDNDFAAKLKSLRNQGYIESSDYLNQIELGYNYRMSDINAALGIAQLSRIEMILERRQASAIMYSNLLQNIPNINLPFSESPEKRSFFNYAILAKDKEIRTSIIKSLSNNDIEYSLGFAPLHKFAHIRKKINQNDSDFPITNNISERLIYLPFFTEISEQQINQVADVIKKML